MPLPDLQAAPSAQDALDMSLSVSGVSTRPEMPEDRDKRRRQVTAALIREAAGICAAIENVVLNAKQQAKQPQMKLDRLYITGGGSKLKGLAEFMGRRLRVEVMPLEPLRGLSLTRLSPAQADALRDEQHTLSVALGLALSDLRKGAYNFYFCPVALKNRREFWARGAYLYYAAGAAALAMGAFMYTPYANTDLLNHNFSIAEAAFREARTKNEDVKKVVLENNELRHRLQTVTDNVQSGDYFLNLLAELKSKSRIQDDIYLTSISTNIPNVALVDVDDKPAKDSKPADTGSKEPDSFLAQRRVYLRGFSRGQEKENLIKPIEDFRDRLVPNRLDPDSPANLFKDIRIIWISREDNLFKEGVYLKEFVLEAYTASASKDVAAKDTDKKKKGKDGKEVPAANPNAGEPAAPAPAQPTQPVARPIPAQPAPMPVQPEVIQQPAIQEQPAAVPVLPAAIPAQPAAIPAQPGVIPVQPQAIPVPPPVIPAQPRAIPEQPAAIPVQPATSGAAQ